MDWAINAVGLLFLTALTGSVCFLFWYGFRGRLDRLGYDGLLFGILRVNSVFFLVPFVYILFRCWDGRTGVFGGVLFLGTEYLREICRKFFLIWLAGVLWLGGWYGVWESLLHWELRTGNRGTFEEREHFREVCLRLGIPEGKVRLYHSYHVLSPCLVGVWRPRIFLPEEIYSRAEREIIFLHELTHYRRKDLWLKKAARSCITIAGQGRREK